MLNLYIAPKSGKAPVPSPDALEAAIVMLKKRGIIGAMLGPSEYAPGTWAAHIFHADVNQHLLPAEQTFESFSMQVGSRVTFLPINQDIHEFHSVTCSICDDQMDVLEFQDALDRLGIFPVERVTYECPSCRTELSFRELDFGQNVSFARFWLHLEGLAFGRLSSQFIDSLSKSLGMSLVVVPEVIDDQAEKWAHVRRLRFTS